MIEAVEVALGAVARAALTRVLVEGQSAASRMVIDGVVLSYETDPGASRALLQQLLTAARIERFGYAEVPWLAQRAALLSKLDADLLLDLYEAAFTHTEESRETTVMREGVLTLTSNQAQDWAMARYALGSDFKEVLRHDAGAALDALRVVTTVIARRRHPSGRRAEVAWAGGRIGVLADGSASWDSQGVEHDISEILDAFQHHLVTLLDDAFDDASQLLWAMCGADWPAVVIARVLEAAIQTADALLEWASALLDQPEFLLVEDLEIPAARAMAAAFNVLPTEDRQRIENVVLGLAEHAETERAVERAAYRTEQLLGQIAPERLVSAAARQRRAELDAGDGPPPVGFPKFAGWTGPPRTVPPRNAEEARLRELVEPLAVVHEARTRNAEAPTDPRALIPAARALLDVVSEVTDKVDANALNEAAGHLGEVAMAIGRQPSGEPTRDERTLMRDSAIWLQTCSQPMGGEDLDARWDSEAPAYGWPTPRADAADVWLLLAAHGECDEQLLAGVRAATSDSSAVVRSRVADRVWWLRDTAPDVAWELAEHLADHEPRWFVAVSTLVSLRALASLDIDRAHAAVTRLHERALAGGAPRWAIKSTSTSLLASYVIANTAAGQAEMERLEALVASDPAGARHIFFAWREALTRGDDKPDATSQRLRAIQLWTRVTRVAVVRFEALLAATDDARAEQPHYVKALGELLITSTTEVQFAAGASGLDRRPDEWQPTAHEHARLWQEAAHLFDLVCRIGIARAADHVVKTLASYVTVDPLGVLGRLVIVLDRAESFGYQSDSLAESTFNQLVGRLLAGYRDVVLADEEARQQLLHALASFARAGSSSARRTLLGLDDLLR